MRTRLRWLLWALLFGPTSAKGAVMTATVEVNILGLRSDAGCVRAALWAGPQGFPNKSEQAQQRFVLPVAHGRAHLCLSNMPEGDYALAVFHDENNNGKLDTHLFGIPKEGIGFSNSPRVRFGAPSFEACRFAVSKQTGSSLDVHMQYFLR